jgi:PAS domain S-box-containing protein
MRFHISIGLLLGCVFGVFLLVMVLEITSDQQHHREDLIEHIEAEAVSNTLRTVYQLTPYTESAEWESAEMVLYAMSLEVLPQRFRLFDLEGDVLLDVRTDNGMSSPIVTRADLELAERVRDALIDKDEDNYRYRVMIPVYNSSGVIAVAVNDVHWHEEAEHMNQEDIQRLVGLIIPAMIVAAALLLLLWKWIGQPLNSLEMLMTAVINGGSDERAQPFLAYELNHLGTAVNTMLDSVQQRERMKELELRRQQEIDLELRRYRDKLEELVETRTEALVASEQTAQDFQKYLKILNNISLEFSTLDSVDAICQKAVEYGLSSLGFDRMGLFLIDEERQLLLGTYGTDEQGNMRSEQDYQASLTTQASWLNEVLESKQHSTLWRNVELMDYYKQVSIGWNGTGALWDGDKVIGYFAVDNLIHKRDPRPYESELLSLYGAALGHAIARQRATDERVKSEMRFRTVLEKAPVAILLCNGEGQIILSNHSADQLFQYKKQGLVNQSIHMLLPDLARVVDESSWERLITAHDEAQAQFTSFGHDLAGITHSGTQFDAETVLTSIQIGTERVILAFVIDMSQHRQAEKQRLELSLERERTTILSRFIRDAAHEFGTPLSVIRTASYIIGKKQGDANIVREQQDRIRQQAEHIHKLVSALTTMARLDGTFYSNLEGVNLYEIVTATISEYASQVQIIEHLEEPQALIRGNVNDLSLALWQVFNNAAQFSDGKPIEVTLKRTDNEIMVRVTDHGEGMPAEILNRVYERFYRGDDAHSTRGFGLGMPIAKRVIDLHKGTIEIDSAVGQGTTVTIRLPAELQSEAVS